MNKTLTLLLILILLLASPVFAQEETQLAEKPIELSLMPYVSYNRTMGGMFGLLPMAMYRVNPDDHISPKSMAMVNGVWTTNGSWFASVMNRSYFGEGNWRASFVAMIGNKNASTTFVASDSPFDLPEFDGLTSFSPSSSAFEADYSNQMFFTMLSLQYQFIPHLFAGANYSFLKSQMDYSEESGMSNTTTNISTISLVANYDTRNDQYYPTSGSNSKLQWMNNPDFMNDFTANRLRTEYNAYYGMHADRDVLAVRYNGQFGLGDVVFQQQETIGGKDLRGYSSGKYRGDGMIDVQAEYRLNPFDKVGFVGFAGIATIYGSTVEEYNWKAYPGAGVGVRYRAFKTTKMNIGLDAAVGKEDWGIYFRVAEAF